MVVTPVVIVILGVVLAVKIAGAHYTATAILRQQFYVAGTAWVVCPLATDISYVTFGQCLMHRLTVDPDPIGITVKCIVHGKAITRTHKLAFTDFGKRHLRAGGAQVLGVSAAHA